MLATSATEAAGGKGANQAVAASRLGGEVAIVGRVGDDEFGERMLRGFIQENLDPSLVRRTADCASGTAIVAVEDSGENSIVVVPGANGRVCPEDIAVAAEVIRACDVLLMQLEICREAVAAAMAIARQSGVRTILNPAPAAKPLPEELLQVDVLCPNRLEASAILGRAIESREDAVDAAARLVSMGPKSAIVTMGSLGAVFSTGGPPAWCEPFQVEAVDSTAAGDAFAGALAVRLGEGAALGEAVEFACAAGAIAATQHGAQPALPTRSAVDRLLATRSPSNRS